MWTSIRTLLSLNDPGWGRSGSGGQNDDRPPQRPGGGNDGPPDLDELWRDFNRRLNRMFGKGGGGEPPRGGGGAGGGPSMRGAGAGIGLIAGVGFLLWLGSGFYIIQEGQAAAVLRFGEFRYMVEQAGFKWRMPAPIETAELVDVQRLRQVEDGLPQVMGIALHPYIVGQPHRLRALRRALALIARARDDVWITTAGAVFDHAAALPAGVVPGCMKGTAA